MLESRAARRNRTRAPWIVAQAALFVGLVVVYFGVRGLTVGSTADAVANAHDIVDLERTFGINVESSIQRAFIDSEAVETAANWVYIWGHWPVIIVTLIWLAARHRDAFRRLRDAMVLSGAVGMVVYATYPVSPPRLANLGLVDTISKESESYRVLQPPAFVNQYAAMPSLHSGWDLLVGIAIVSAASGVALKVVGVVMPVLMAAAVVLTANHYILDVVAGVALVLVAHVAALAIERRRHRRRRDRVGGRQREARLDRPARAGGA